MAHDAPPAEAGTTPAPPAETDLFALAARVRDRKSLTGAQRDEIVAILVRVGGGRMCWDGHAERFPDDDVTGRAHQMRGVLAFVLDRPLKRV
jgi:hypothetical protein